MNEEREMVLRMLKEGKISVEEADALLQALAEETGAPAEEPRESPARTGVDVRVELGDLIKEITESVPREVIHELRELRHLKDLKQLGRIKDVKEFKHGWRGILNAIQGLAEGQAEDVADLAMAPTDTLEIANAWGDLRLRRSADGRLRVKARKRVWSATREEAQRLAEGLRVGPRREGSRVLVGASMVMEARRRIDLEIDVPAGVAVAVEVAKGDVRAEGLDGSVQMQVARGDVHVADQGEGLTLSIASGDVSVKRAGGDVTLDIKSGDVTAVDVRGKLAGRILNGDVECQRCASVTLDVLNGDISVAHSEGDIELEVRNGDIEITGARGRNVRPRTLSGDIQVTVAALPEGGTLSVETMRGDVVVALPADSRATIDAATMSGDVACRLPLQERSTDRGTMRRRVIRGILNAPGALVTLRTTSGDIQVVESAAGE
ncbi:MAG TPA: DUF4097 family beta strand repeat-containing protein [bacterium]|jgi:hypothetical protein|nr:DUF4097 family beta strand repeat-containing protein [bacterium]